MEWQHPVPCSAAPLLLALCTSPPPPRVFHVPRIQPCAPSQPSLPTPPPISSLFSPHPPHPPPPPTSSSVCPPTPSIWPCVPSPPLASHPVYPATHCHSTLNYYQLPGIVGEGSLHTAVATDTQQQSTSPPPSLSSPSLLAVVRAGWRQQRGM